jgi:hypothetical protein
LEISILTKFKLANSNMTTTTASTAKKVTFKPETTINHIPGKNDLSREEIDSMWYNNCDKIRIRKEILVTAKYMGLGVTMMNHDNYCLRGLSNRSKSRKQRFVRKCSVRLVLKEQSRQKEQGNGYYDEEAFADAYLKATSHCQMEALIRGIGDSFASESSSSSPKRRFSTPLRHGSPKLRTSPLHQPRRVSSMQDEDYKTRKPRQMCGRAA